MLLRLRCRAGPPRRLRRNLARSRTYRNQCSCRVTVGAQFVGCSAARTRCALVSECTGCSRSRQNTITVAENMPLGGATGVAVSRNVIAVDVRYGPIFPRTLQRTAAQYSCSCVIQLPDVQVPLPALAETLGVPPIAAGLPGEMAPDDLGGRNQQQPSFDLPSTSPPAALSSWPASMSSSIGPPDARATVLARQSSAANTPAQF